MHQKGAGRAVRGQVRRRGSVRRHVVGKKKVLPDASDHRRGGGHVLGVY